MDSDLTFLKIKKILKWTWENKYSSFYRDKYKKAGIVSYQEVKTLEDFKKLPFLTREELVNCDPFRFMFFPQSKAARISLSSGTSSVPLILFKQAKKTSTSFVDSVLKKHKVKRILVLHGTSSGNSLVHGRGIPQSFCRIVGDITNLPLTAILAARTKIQAIDTTATILLFFVPYLKAKHNISEIKVVKLSGEYISQKKMQVLKILFPHAKFLVSYGSTEGGHLGRACEYLQETSFELYHLTPSYYFELADSRTDGYIDENESGEIAITHLFKTLTPLIRYRTGDLGSFQKITCRCENKNSILKILGRANVDSIKVLGTTLHVEAFESALDRVKHFVRDDYTIHVYEEKRGERLLVKLRFELVKRNGAMSEDRLKVLLSEQIGKFFYLSPKRTLFDLVEQGVFLPAEITFVNSFPLEVKKRRIISHL